MALTVHSYWGWWVLGRPVSFSPMELAKVSLPLSYTVALAHEEKAFESPLLADCNSNSSGRDVAKFVGEKSIRYGVVKSSPHGEKTRLAFADPGSVGLPRKGERFDV